MALARNVGQALEGIDRFALSPVSDCQSCLTEKVAPNLPKVAFGFQRYDVRPHGSERSASHESSMTS